MKVISINTKTDKVLFTLDAHADAVTGNNSSTYYHLANKDLRVETFNF